MAVTLLATKPPISGENIQDLIQQLPNQQTSVWEYCIHTAGAFSVLSVGAHTMVELWAYSHTHLPATADIHMKYRTFMWKVFVISQYFKYF